MKKLILFSLLIIFFPTTAISGNVTSQNETFRMLDANSDGMLSEQEFRTVNPDMLNQSQTNQNMDRSEFSAFESDDSFQLKDGKWELSND